jgi:putative Mn2+ efflux pump MntP
LGLAELVVLGLGLSMDAFAVSISNTMCFKDIRAKQRLAAAASFGLFQGIMPLIGFFAGRLLGVFIQAMDHWVAMALLGFIGGKMLAEGIRSLRRPGSCPVNSPFTFKILLTQAVATSIDALAVGVSFAALAVNIWYAASLIALLTFACCALGGLLGKRFGLLLGDWAQIFGGLILMGIGAKIFIEHMFFAG